MFCQIEYFEYNNLKHKIRYFYFDIKDVLRTFLNSRCERKNALIYNVRNHTI